ncbi:unnamed protein product [Amoebophrya sp. A25]|nr:unnamed protein product [Amoebophrya sp. A25]|eukprot:GSA25T00021633001.1
MLQAEAQRAFEACIAEVGVDLNTCSVELLQYVPGIGRQRAADIVAARTKHFRSSSSGKNGTNQAGAFFESKVDLMKKVKGIGVKIFEQCSGFVYVSGTTADVTDRTPHIHPDQVPAVRLLQKIFGGTDLPHFDKAKLPQVLQQLTTPSGQDGEHESQVFLNLPKSSGPVDGGSSVSSACASNLVVVAEKETGKGKKSASTKPMKSASARSGAPKKASQKCQFVFDLATLEELCQQLIPPERGGRAGVDPRWNQPRPVLRDLSSRHGNAAQGTTNFGASCSRGRGYNNNSYNNNSSGAAPSTTTSSGGAGVASSGMTTGASSIRTRNDEGVGYNYTRSTRPDYGDRSNKKRGDPQDLQRGDPLEGVVRNVTQFGAFVDVGVGSDGLIHISKFQGRSLQVNEVLQVEVENVEWKGGKYRISLFLPSP